MMKETESAATPTREAVQTTDPPLRANVRAILRGLAIAVWTPALFAVRMSAVPLAFIAPRAERRFRNGIFRFWARGVLRIAGFQIEIAGTPPKPPFALVSNHLSYVDVVVYIALVSGVFVSMAEVRSWPVLGFIARHMNTVFIDRQCRRDTMRVGDAIGRALDDGFGVTLFPEGTTSTGEDVLPFKGALLEPMARRGFPVHFAKIGYQTAPGDPPPSDSVCWVDDTPFGTHVLRVLRLRRTRVWVAFGNAPVVDEDRKALADALRLAAQRQV